MRIHRIPPYDSRPVYVPQLRPEQLIRPGFIRRRQAQEFRAAGWCILVEAKDCPQFTPGASRAAANHPAKAGSVRGRKVGLRRANALHALLQAPAGVYECCYRHTLGTAECAGSRLMGIGGQQSRAAHAELRYGFRFRASSQGARNGGTCRRASSHHPPSPSSPSKSEGLYCCARRYYLPIIGASLPPSSPRVKLPFFPISSPLRHSCAICVFFAYYSPMFRLWSAYEMHINAFWEYMHRILFRHCSSIR